jgi:hypothetical protein
MTANVSRTTNDQNDHVVFLSIRMFCRCLRFSLSGTSIAGLHLYLE